MDQKSMEPPVSILEGVQEHKAIGYHRGVDDWWDTSCFQAHARKLCDRKDLFFGCFLVASQIFKKK